jgi:hypothetical protein
MILPPDAPLRRDWLAFDVSRLTVDDVACWVLKTSAPPGLVAPGWRPGTVRELDRCVRRSYRLGLVAPGQPCLLWRSGRTDPGVHALGTVAGPVGEVAGSPVVVVRLTLLDRPVPRAGLLADPAFRNAEVLRMPAGSNPSWLSAAEHAAVLAHAGPPADGSGRSPGTMRRCVAIDSGGERSAGS